jgi:hypothetical protein
MAASKNVEWGICAEDDCIGVRLSTSTSEGGSRLRRAGHGDLIQGPKSPHQHALVGRNATAPIERSADLMPSAWALK